MKPSEKTLKKIGTWVTWLQFLMSHFSLNIRNTEVFFKLSLFYVYVYETLLRWAGQVARMEENRSAFKIFTGKPAEKRHLARPRRTWEKEN